MLIRTPQSLTAGGSIPPRLSVESGDSEMFSESMELNETSSRDINKGVPRVFAVTVGKKPSNAQFYVNDVDEVSELLEALQSQLFSGG
eukprot:CAMPEP_0113857624 /NCGR_PEP_ID=MMETSP0372-20130328/10399_1 /TAXON_ID=340204 /ORGANISM="Lankesteria abbotti" /LENGTH=87 /DNA_ID=CAMNT_0000833765 /DNA_START=95 /DNA_END=358 /DNA_ORIENTATION=- /assembly_acc=CAM_ASM_000359